MCLGDRFQWSAREGTRYRTETDGEESVATTRVSSVTPGGLPLSLTLRTLDTVRILTSGSPSIVHYNTLTHEVIPCVLLGGQVPPSVSESSGFISEVKRDH